MPLPADLTAVLAKLRERFAASAGNTLSAFSQLADQLQRTPAAPEVVDAVRRELHRVHGTAGSYGFHEASRLAGALELVAVRWTADPSLDRARRGAVLRQFVRALGAALAPASGGKDSPLSRRLLLVDLEDEVAAPFVTEGMHRGFFVERTTASELDTLLDASLPQAVIAGARLPIHVPEGIPLVLLQGADGVVAPHGPQVRVVDVATAASEVLQVAESLAAHAGMAGATMLAVDDDPAMLDLLRVLGESEGMFVQTRGDASALVAALDDVRPALLLLDVAMPGEDGIAVTRRLRAERRFAELPILLVSAQSDAETRAAAFAAGADDFQSKPIVALELTRRISRLLELRRQRLVVRGIHPATGLWLPDRTIRAFDETLATAAAVGRPAALAVLRPLAPTDGLHRLALWHRECARVAAGVSADGATAGFIDDTSLAVLLPMDGAAAAARLAVFAEASASDDVAWCAGVSDLRPGADAHTRVLIRSAEEGWLAARDAGVPVHRWDEADAGIAPDVVLVEDDPALADLVGFALTARGLTHRVFRTGPEALEGLLALRVHQRKPVVLLDVDLPGLDGFSLFERLRVERPSTFHVVFLSVHSSEANQLRALRAGALDYLAKPVSLRVLMAKIVVWRDAGRSA